MFLSHRSPKQLVQISPKSCSYPIVPEQKARTTYDNLLRLIDDPDVREPLKFLREREVVHFQRFGDALRVVQDNLDAKNYYAYNPSIDIRPNEKYRICKEMVTDRLLFCANTASIRGTVQNKFEHFTV